MTERHVYTPAFYRQMAEVARGSAEPILAHLFTRYRPRRVADVGGGTGAWACAAKALGVQHVRVIDGSTLRSVDDDALLVDRGEFVERDLRRPLRIEETFDLALCMEVAEHLPVDRAEGLVADLCRLAPCVLFSAALPYQGGDLHVNEMWPEYWAQLFRQQGYRVLDVIRPQVWSDRRIGWWYRQNSLVFATPEVAARCFPDSPPDTGALTRIHPELYLAGMRREWNVPYGSTLEEDIEIYYRPQAPRPGGYGEEFDFSVPPLGRVERYGHPLRAVVVGPDPGAVRWVGAHLRRHPQVFAFGGTRELAPLHQRFGAGPAPTGVLAEAFLASHDEDGGATLAGWLGRVGRTRAHLEAFFARLEGAHPRCTVGALRAWILAYLLTFAKRSVAVDVTPEHIHHLPALLGDEPNCKVVLVTRAAAPAEPALWARAMEAARAATGGLDPTQLLILPWEDLRAEAAPWGRRLLRFVGVDVRGAWIDDFTRDAAAVSLDDG